MVVLNIQVQMDIFGPKFVLAQTKQGGLGDQLEHYVFSLYIATLLHATIVIMDLRKV